MRGYNERDRVQLSLASLAEPRHVRAASATPTSAATIRGRLLLFRARFNCGYYSRAATIRGAATIKFSTNKAK